MTTKERELREKRASLFHKMSALNDKLTAGTITNTERAKFDKLSKEMHDLDRQIEVAQLSEPRYDSPAGEIRPAYDVKPVEGRANEPLTRGQTFTEWLHKAQENDVTVMTGDGYGTRQKSLRSEGTDRDVNRAFGEMLGFAKRSVETRALGEDTAGSGQAIAPQAWTSAYIDVLLPGTLIDKLGATKIPMSTEYYNYPVFTSTVSPSWIAEGGSISLDANPAFSSLQLIAQGGFKDTTQYSLELAEDAYIQGDLPGFLARAVAKKFQVVLDTAMLLGVTSNPGIPGLINESGFITRKQTADSGSTGHAPADTTELGVVAELTVKKNVMPSAFVSNIGTHEAFERIPVTSYGRYWEDPPIVRDMDWVTSENSALSYTETDATPPAQTGGSYSSLYCGPWNKYLVLGVRTDLATIQLKERYIDSGEFALFSYLRYSIRFAHPETFTRTVGVITV